MDYSTVLDWKNKKEEALLNGVHEEKLESMDYHEIFLDVPEAGLSNYIIRNFPKLTIESANLVNCKFEDCGDIDLQDSEVINCEFCRVDTIMAEDTTIIDSFFCELDCSFDSTIILTDSGISGGIFDKINMRDEAYLVRCSGTSWIKDCRFDECYTERNDCELIFFEDDENDDGRKTQAMGIIKGCLKVAGSAALVVTGTASTILKGMSDTAGIEIGSQIFGATKDASFNGLRAMWDGESANEVIDKAEDKSYAVEDAARRKMADTAYKMAQAAKRNGDMDKYESYMAKYYEYK